MRNNKISFIVKIMFALMLGYVILFTNVKTSILALLSNNTEVEKNSDLIYYLDISYEGVDKYGINSNEQPTTNLNSGKIEVQDKIPNGLVFEGFVTTNNGTIGAYNKDDGTSCHGKVIDDTPNSNGEWNSDNTEYTYHGLHYNANTRIISFNVENLQAGCILTVGIKTKTPAEIDDKETGIVESRRDFYNISSIQEENTITNSNMTHAYMGTNDVEKYNVEYKYNGTIPSNAPTLPEITSYIYGTKVGVIPEIKLEGYNFKWSSKEVTIENGFFLMPQGNVEITGTFTELPKYKVNYKIDGEMPQGYILPLTKEYYLDSEINIDTLSKGDVIGEYEFQGWKINNKEVSSKFTMPNSNIDIIGKFTKLKYKVQYRFYDSVLPENSSDYLPKTTEHPKGELVELDNNITEPEGYKFLGWYYEEKFNMPSTDLVVYGEWKKVLGTFKPSIEQSLISEIKSYNPGEEIQFKVTINNPELYSLKNVMIKSDLEKFEIESEYDIKIESNQYVKFENIDAQSSVNFILKYVVNDSDYNKIESEVEIIGALAENGYEISNGNYKVITSAKLSKELIQTPITDKNVFPVVTVATIIIIIGIGLIIYAKKTKK